MWFSSRIPEYSCQGFEFIHSKAWEFAWLTTSHMMLMLLQWRQILGSTVTIPQLSFTKSASIV